MFVLLKLNALFTALKALVARFPNSRADAGALFSEIETLVLTKAWTLTAAYDVIGKAEKLVGDFVTEWDGSRPQWDAFQDALTALFA